MNDREIQLNLKIESAQAASSVKDIKQALKDLKSEAIAFGEGSEGFKKATKAAGELEDKLSAVKDGIKSFNASPIENITNSFSSLFVKIRSLDFGGAKQEISNLTTSIKEVAKGMLGITEATSFASKGFKILGGAVAATGIGLLIVAITVLVTQFDSLSKRTGLVGDKLRELTKWFGELKEKALDGINNLVNGFIDLYNNSLPIRTSIQAIVLTFKTLVDAVITGGKVIIDYFSAIGNAFLYIFKGKNPLDSLKEGFKNIKGDIKDFKDNFVTNFNQAADTAANSKLKHVDLFGEVIKDSKKDGNKAGTEFKKGVTESIGEIELITPASKAKALKEMQDFLSQFKQKVEITPITTLPDSFKKPEPIVVPYKMEWDKDSKIDVASTALDKLSEKFKEITEQIGGFKGAVVDVFGQAAASINEAFKVFTNEDASLGDKINAGLQVAMDVVNTIGNALQEKSNERIQANQQETSERIAALEQQASAGLISEQQLAEGKDKINKEAAKKDLELRRKAFNQNKAIQIVNAVIGTAQGVVSALANPFPLNIVMAALAGITGAVNIGLIASQKFPEGGTAPTAPVAKTVAAPSQNSIQAAKPSQASLYGTASKENNLGYQSNVTGNQPTFLRAYVTESDVTSTQTRVKRYQTASEL